MKVSYFILILVVVLIGCTSSKVVPEITPKIVPEVIPEIVPRMYAVVPPPITFLGSGFDISMPLGDYPNTKPQLDNFSLFHGVDMDQMISDMQILKKHPLTEDEVETLTFKIYNKEKELGIDNFWLFRFLAKQSGFEAIVSDYTPDEDISFKLSWESNLRTGWIDFHWWRYQYWSGPGFKYTYSYKIISK